MQWLRKGLLVWALGISLSTANDQNSKYLIQKKQELIETLEQNTTSPSNWETHKESLEEESLKAIHTDTITNLNSTPFATSGRTRMISPTLGNILGYGQAETIMREQNFYPSPLEFQATQRYDLYKTLSYPLIYPELKENFPTSREDFINKPEFEKYKNEKADHMLVVTKVWEGRNALAYYENGILKMATHVSIWLPYRKTITGAYDLSHDMIFRRSRKFDNAAIPYALHITEGFFLHQWWSDGQPRSHWCIRVPGLYQKWLYEHLPKQKKADENADFQPARIILDHLYD